MKLTNEHNPLPLNAERCIWMEAGQISYKLCDRGFECEGCPFDGIMQSRTARRYDRFVEPDAIPSFRNRVPEASAINASESSITESSMHLLGPDEQFELQLENLLKPFTQVRLPDDRQYTRDHVWIQEESHEMWRFGLDHLGVTMFSSIAGVVFSQTPSRIERGAPCMWVIHLDGAQALPAPMTGTLLYANRSMGDMPSALTKFPYTDGWMMTISPERNNTRLSGLMDPADAADHFVQQGQVLRVALRDAYHQMRPAVGPTLNDGGTGSLTVPQMLGLSTYYRIVHKYFYAP